MQVSAGCGVIPKSEMLKQEEQKVKVLGDSGDSVVKSSHCPCRGQEVDSQNHVINAYNSSSRRSDASGLPGQLLSYGHAAPIHTNMELRNKINLECVHTHL